MKYPGTKRMLELEAVLARLIAANNGISPTHRELAQELDISIPAVTELVRRGVERGRLRCLPRLPRSLQIVQDKDVAA